MSGKTNIEWATRSWNPTVGCTRVSDGCDNCYAYYLHDRMRFAPNVRAARELGFRTPTAARLAGHQLPLVRQYDVPFSQVQLFPDRLAEPAMWPDAELIFVDSMADLLHEAVPDNYIEQVFNVADEVSRHAYLILSKRPERYTSRVVAHWGARGAPDNVWIGTSVEDEKVLFRVDELRAAPARVRFLSCEPLIGPLTRIDLTGIHWVIVGGESGRRRRPIDPGWVTEIRDMCVEARVAFFFKQWGGLTPKAGGRDLDGRMWNDYPDVALTPSPAARQARADAERTPAISRATPNRPAGPRARRSTPSSRPGSATPRPTPASQVLG
jgi:protein gp37